MSAARMMTITVELTEEEARAFLVLDGLDFDDYLDLFESYMEDDIDVAVTALGKILNAVKSAR